MTTKTMTIKGKHGEVYHKSLITLHLVFFVDDYDGIIMFWLNNPCREPLQGYGAHDSLIEVVLQKKWIWASDEMKFNIKCILEEEENNEDP